MAGSGHREPQLESPWLSEIERRFFAYRDALILCAEIAGEDGEAIEAARSGAMKHPELEEFALAAVRQLRSDYDEACKELHG